MYGKSVFSNVLASVETGQYEVPILFGFGIGVMLASFHT